MLSWKRLNILAAAFTFLLAFSFFACQAGLAGEKDSEEVVFINARNFILFIGDGMGEEHVRAAGLYLNGKEGTLVFETFPHRALMTTFAAKGEITDSAASATAMATGVEVSRGVISMAIPGDERPLKTVLEYFKEKGRSTGLVTTTYISHATPAAFGAHQPSRKHFLNIILNYLALSKPNVLFGGARQINPFLASKAGYTVIKDRLGLLALDTETQELVSGQFSRNNLPFVSERPENVPGLPEMTEVALGILDNDPDGFFLMVEGGRIDHAAHRNDIKGVVGEVIEFSEAVGKALDWASKRSDTLIIVTSDHETGGLEVLSEKEKGELLEVSWSTEDHTSKKVPVYAWGLNAERISGEMDNTDIFNIIIRRSSTPEKRINRTPAR